MISKSWLGRISIVAVIEDLDAIFKMSNKFTCNKTVKYFKATE